MIRLIKYLVLLVIALGLVTVALANRGPMTVKLLPDELLNAVMPDQAAAVSETLNLTLPGFLMVMAIFFAGLLFGFIWEWLREHKHRSTARVDRRERERLEREVSKVAPTPKDGDDVLAILDGR